MDQRLVICQNIPSIKLLNIDLHLSSSDAHEEEYKPHGLEAIGSGGLFPRCNLLTELNSELTLFQIYFPFFLKIARVRVPPSWWPHNEYCGVSIDQNCSSCPDLLAERAA